MAELARNERFDLADRVIWVGIVANVVLTVLKMTAGWYGHSQAVFADGVESACDLVVCIGSMVALRISRQPWDTRHPYGHGKAESIAALVVGLVIMGTGIYIVANSLHVLLAHAPERPQWIAVAAAAFTVVSKEGLARYTFRRGRRIGSPSLLALAQDHRKDAITSVATVIGAGGAMLGLLALDPIVAGITALLILKTGWGVFHGASQDLMDAAIPEEMERGITAIARQVEGVEHVHEIKGRRSGQYVIVDMKLEMDGGMTVARSHQIASEVKCRIFAAHPAVGDVMIHVNPHDDPDHQDLIRL